MRRPKSDKRSVWIKTAISLLLVTAGCILLSNGLKRTIEPNMDAVSRLKAKGIVTELINQTVREEFSKKEFEKDLLLVKTGKDGTLQMVQANTPLMNKMAAGFAERLQKKYDDMDGQTVDLSYGTLLGSKLLSQTGLHMQMKVLPMSVTRYDFETEFVGKGINQTKYKVYIVLESSVRILQPFSDRDVKIKNKVLISEVVIVGDVPGSYVNVPKEDILDVT